MNKKDIPVDEFQTALLQMDRLTAAKLFENCYQTHDSLEALILLTMQTLEHIGTGWENGQLSLSQVYMSGVICEELVDKYMPKTHNTYKDEPKIAIAVLQDCHTLGKRIVTAVLRSAGYHLLDMGYGLTPEEIVEQALEQKVDVLLISVLMMPSALQVKKVVNLLREKGSTAKVIVGGAPFRMDESLWRQVGADADGKKGTDVIQLIETMLKGGQPI